MEKNKRYSTSLFVILCLLLNLSGKCLAQWLKLPIWMDSFGTIAATYVLGPVCGVIVGVTLNTLYSIIYSWTYICYAVVSALIAVIAGVCIKKDYMKTLLGALTASFYIAFVSCVVSVIFNYIFFNGYTNNIWGDGVIDSLISIGFNNIISYAAGEFYVDFLDKVIAVLILFVFVKFDKGWKRFDKRVISVCLMFALASSVIARIGQNMNLSIEAQAKTQNEQQKDSDVMVQSDNDKIQDYSSYLQTVYGRENGIPGGCANDIVQTNDGILWIGTYGGLYRYNGKEFVWIDEYDSIKSVNCMYLDEEGRLWIGTNDNGLSIMINEQVANVVSEKDGLSDDAVKCITQGTDGCYYVGTTGKMSVLSMAGGLSVKKVIDDVTYAVSIDADKSGNVAAVSDSGKLSVIRDTDVISQYVPADGSTYTTCTFDEDGILYAGTSADSIDVYRVDEGIPTLIDNHKCNELKNIKKDDEFSYWNINTKSFWTKYEEVYKNKKLNELMLENIRYITDKLKKEYHIEFATKLILRVIFIRFLIDKGIDICYDGFSNNIQKSQQKLIDISQDKNKLYKLFVYLKEKFNGNLFELSGELEDNNLNEDVFILISDFLSGTEVLWTGQQSFFPMYDFDIIPVSLISNIYEILLGKEKQKKDKAFYTPDYLAKFATRQAMGGIKIGEKLHILDPACGSRNIFRGMF